MSHELPAEWYSYAVIRVVPRVEREEFVNAGIVLFVRASRTICTRINFDARRLLRLAPDAEIETIKRHLEMFKAVASGQPDGGPIAELPVDERFHWLTAPRSTVIQVSTTHEGQTANISATLDHLFDCYISGMES